MNRMKLKCASVAGLAALAVVTGPAAAGAAAVTSHAPTAAPAAAPRPTLTAKATVGSVRAWQQFRVYGVSHHMRTGTRVTLQQKQHNRWVTLPASMNTTRSATYNMRVKIGLKGHNALRIVGGGAVSPVVNVTVR